MTEGRDKGEVHVGVSRKFKVNFKEVNIYKRTTWQFLYI